MLQLPFTTDQFLEVFRDYNNSIWPAQILAYILGILAIVLAVRNKPAPSQVVSNILIFFWVWMGIIYHITFFSAINKAAYFFGVLFAIQGILFFFARSKLQYRYRNDAYGITGIILILYAMVIYPVLGTTLGQTYPYVPVFGVAPCPTVIFTFGLLLWTSGRVPVWLLIIPGLWAIIGFTAALRLGIAEDIGLIVAGAAGILLLLLRNHQKEGGLAV